MLVSKFSFNHNWNWHFVFFAQPSRYTAATLPKIDAIVLFGEPTRWETNMQLIIDILMTNGTLNDADTSGYGEQRVPVLACNMDLQWMSDFSMPRWIL